MSTRYWTRPDPPFLQLNEDHLELVFNFIERQSWMYTDMRTYRDQNRTADWLQCFFCYISTFLIDCPELRRVVWSSRIRPNLVNSSGEVQAVAMFVWENLHWLKHILPECIRIINPTMDYGVILM